MLELWKQIDHSMLNVGLPDEPAKIEGGDIFSYDILNNYIKKKTNN